MTGRRAASLAACAALVASTATARADVPDAGDAETSFKRGLAEMSAGRFDAGCPLLEQSHRLAPNELGVLFTLAECEWKRGRLATAAARYQEFLDAVAFLPPAQRAGQADREKIALEQRGMLAPDVPRLVLGLPAGAPRGTAVLLDGVAVLVPLTRDVDPGAHTVEARLPGGERQITRITVVRGERRELTITLPSDAPKPPAPPEIYVPPPASAPRISWAAWTAGGIGLAGIGVGIGTGIATLSKGSKAKRHCPHDLCDAEGLDAVSAGRATGAASTIAFAVGAAGFGAAALILAIDHRAAARNAARSGGLTISLAAPGRFEVGGSF